MLYSSVHCLRHHSLEQVLSAVSNIVGLAVTSRCWSSGLLTQHYPEHLSTEGVVNLQLWGVAYLAAAHILNWKRHPQPWIFVVLALQKVFCTGTWVWWLLYKQKRVAVGGEPPCEANLGQIWNTDPITALFFATYGAADFGFACIFFCAAELGFAAPPPPQNRRTTPTRKETTLRTLVYLGAVSSRYDAVPAATLMLCSSNRNDIFFTISSLCVVCCCLGGYGQAGKVAAL